MSIGLPGSGIGGVFYLASALLMPMHGMAKSIRQRSLAPLRQVRKQTMLAAAIVLSLFATAWLIERLILGADGSAFAFATTGVRAGAAALPRVLRAAAFALTFGTLAGVLLMVQLLRLFCARPTVPSAEAGALNHGELDAA